MRTWKAGLPTITVGFLLALLCSLIPSNIDASAYFTYDRIGRLTTAHYDSGLCITYAYDATGNRTSREITPSSAPQAPTWGTGEWGCFSWTP